MLPHEVGVQPLASVGRQWAVDQVSHPVLERMREPVQLILDEVPSGTLQDRSTNVHATRNYHSARISV